MLDPGSHKAIESGNWYLREYVADLGFVDDEYYNAETNPELLEVLMARKIDKYRGHERHLVCFRVWNPHGVEYKVNVNWKPDVSMVPFG